MKSKFFTAILLCCLMIHYACQDKDDMIISKIRDDGPYLAHLEAVYNMVFTNDKENYIIRDDLYVRQDNASVFYGYALEDAEIKIIKEKGERVLCVRLPKPKMVSIDRKVMSVETTHKNYQPVDKNGDPINVDKWIQAHLDEVLKKYEQRTIEMTKTISKQYFETLAKRYELKLRLEFDS